MFWSEMGYRLIPKQGHRCYHRRLDAGTTHTLSDFIAKHPKGKDFHPDLLDLSKCLQVGG